ncbi:MAG TPA: shikimate kinase [Bacteroidia bacterium]|nr:shikimate kinase [Bacteroidia bacterium]
MLIFLIGFMGAGKSSQAKKLAARLNFESIDLDELIEKTVKQSISEIFKISGEQHFRKIESETLKTLSEKQNAVIATGGGTPCFFDNMQWMNEKGITVYLKIHPGTVYHRIAPSKSKRPLISHMNDADLMEYIMETMIERAPFYNQAKIQMSGLNLKTEDLVSALKPFLKD